MRMAAHNIIFAKAGVLCLYESLVQGSSSVFQMNICAKNPRLRKYEKRCEKLQTSISSLFINRKSLGQLEKLSKQ